ncbi:PAS domain-containing sensor histidine kinase [Flavivirga sp. 57AJ16]|uniref:sensor histidine kinase n=1 Tax=Flavivirga sp. 57AJ16 TaxID=3025307 RepID=UPI0023664F1A|nr:HAMP domain-containing sensor histidine kinase [Flavivirga sp. 57AJ16]MDD7888052.1 HAMP domain-containing sensor histidine kinase [Flavivirga sp. 57AJ16]
MVYRKYKLVLVIRVIALFFTLTALAFAINMLDFQNSTQVSVAILIPILITLYYAFRGLYKFIFRRFYEMDDFFESVKYRDFSRWFNEKSGTEDLRELHKGFNEVNKTVHEINKEKEAQHLYLKKILELINTGIIAYHIDSGEVLWINDSFKKNLNVPSLKNVQFVKKRKPDLFNSVFVKNHTNENSMTIEIENEKTPLLIASSIFQIKEQSYKLIVLQNIENTLTQNESKAWKKLLSVMTHEIMNSIAPITSLAETLQSKVQQSIEDPENHQIDINDLNTGIESIKKRSEGLLKFAKTYRSLNKITKLNLSKIAVIELFENIKTLMLPSLANKNMALHFEIENPNLQIEMDVYLIEQVLINLILNSIEACKEIESPKIILSAEKNINGQPVIKIKDNGKGIPNEIIDDVFIPFFSTKKSGSGIGLSLCKQIMLLHKSKIQIKSVEKKGTIASLIFIPNNN